MDEGPKPDGFEKCLRFGCGTLFGGVIVFFTVSRLLFSTGDGFWISIILGTLACGLLAVHYGDRFYHGMLSFFHHWW